MDVTHLPLESITAAPWNANVMDPPMQTRLRASIERFGLVVPLVVRRLDDDRYEAIGGAQRLAVLQGLDMRTVPCVLLETDDANARLLAQALNRIQGEDDLGLRAELLKEVLEQVPQAEVLRLLPETAQSLEALASLGQQDLAEYLQNFQQAQGAKLKHLTFQLTPVQLEIIEEALARMMPQAKESQEDNPNPRGNALFLLCKAYLEVFRREP
jgi:ParB family chromosome partitioning protein